MVVLSDFIRFKYMCFLLKVFELGPDGGDNETDGELLMESDEMPYECGARWVRKRNRDKT